MNAIRLLTSGVGQNIHPARSADGAWILFHTMHFAAAAQTAGQTAGENRVIGEKTDKDMGLTTVRPDGSDLTRLTHGGRYTDGSFSPMVSPSCIDGSGERYGRFPS
jgi:Tol biopolymer transport system component